jgi:glycosyltransferase involved in cell wall biosynthesis
MMDGSAAAQRTATRLPHLLVLEPDPRGHTQEWLDHLLLHSPRERIGRLSLAVAGDLADRLQPLLAHASVPATEVLRLSPAEQRLCLHGSLSVSAFARWHAMRRWLDRSGADHGFFLALDHLALPLAMGLRMGRNRVSGILFRPSVHYGELGPNPLKLRERVRDARKHVLYRRMLMNRTLASVLCLDPFFPRYAAERYPGGQKVVGLPDPVHSTALGEAMESDLASSVPRGRICFVLFGELTERKGVGALLEGLGKLEPHIAERIAIVVAGRLEASLALRARQLAADAVTRLPQLWLRLEDRRLPFGEVAALIRRCQVVLAPYQRFVGSSGTLIWAAACGKPTLTQDYGLLGRFVREHRLGWSVDTTSPNVIADSITAIARGQATDLPDARGVAAFLAGRTPEIFAARVAESLAEVSPESRHLRANPVTYCASE